jgi:hypothetical protein
MYALSLARRSSAENSMLSEYPTDRSRDVCFCHPVKLRSSSTVTPLSTRTSAANRRLVCRSKRRKVGCAGCYADESTRGALGLDRALMLTLREGSAC